MIVIIILSVLISALIGYYVLCALDLRLESFLLQICLSIGIGIGISSLIHFTIMLFTVDRFVIMVAEVSACLLLIGVVHYTKLIPTNFIKSSTLSVTPKVKHWQNLFMFLLLITCIMIFGTSIIAAIQNSHGNWDAWAIWNLRARYLFRSGLDWQRGYAFQSSWSHPDYPLFLPLTLVRMWRYMDMETTSVPIFVSILFLSLTIMTIYASLTFFRGKLFGVIGTLLLLGSPYFVTQGTAQYADIPLSFFFLITWVLMAIYNHKKSTPLFVIVGIAVGLSTWVKNEGLLFAAIFFAVFVIISWLKKYYTQRSILLALFAGFLIAFMFTLFFKLSLAPENDLVTEQTAATILAKLGDLTRYQLIGVAFFKATWNFFQVPIIIFPLILLFIGIDKQKSKQPVISIGVITLILLLIGYFVIYINTPYDIEWHLKTSLPRLYLQLWPSFVFLTMFMIHNFQWAATPLVINNSNEFTNDSISEISVKARKHRE